MRYAIYGMVQEFHDEDNYTITEQVVEGEEALGKAVHNALANDKVDFVMVHLEQSYDIGNFHHEIREPFPIRPVERD